MGDVAGFLRLFVAPMFCLVWVGGGGWKVFRLGEGGGWLAWEDHQKEVSS